MDNLIEQAQWMLAVTLDPWQDLSRALPAYLLRRRPAPAEWSAGECL